MLLENPFDDDTREFVCGIFKEVMPNARVGAAVCDRLFALVDAIKKQQKKQQKRGNMATANHPKIASLPTNTKIPTTTNKTHTPPKDRQIPPVILNNNTNKKKKKQKKATPPRTRSPTKTKTPPKTTHKIKHQLLQWKRSTDIYNMYRTILI